MIALLCFVLDVLISPFKSKSRLETENAALRHQVVVLRRIVHRRVRLTNSDRLFFIQLYRWFPAVLKVITVIRPETLVRWHRAGFRRYWRWKSRSFGGRPQVDTELRALIRRMSVENPLWGAPRIHGELLNAGKFGFGRNMKVRSTAFIYKGFVERPSHMNLETVGCDGRRICPDAASNFGF